MADPSAFYEPEEEELLSSLSVPNYDGGAYDQDQEYQRHMQELESHAFEQHGNGSGQEEQDQAAALESIPQDVKRFLILFHQAILENDLPAITNMYESGWQKLTQALVSRKADEKAHYQSSEWPDPDLVSVLVKNDQVFLTLYRELYFRHVYAKLQPTIDDRFQSYENICELFNYLLNSEEPVPLDLPIQWLWDMLDEFVYQFQSFAQWRANASNKSEEELDLLTEAQQVWSCYSVLNVLYSLVQKSEINAQLKAEKEGKSAEEVAEIGGAFGSKPLYRNLGYFSTICLLRVHVLLGDPTLALQTMENVELGGGALITRITACHVTTYYHVGCAYMALGRWPDAIKTFVSVLIFFVRMKPYHTRSYQYGSISKQCERMYALLAICTTLSPGPTDESIMSIVKEHYADQLQTLQRGGPESLEIYKDLFLSSCPKYLSVNPPPYEDPSALEAYIANPPKDSTQRHLELFLSDVESVRGVSGVRNLLKLYTSIDATKLAAFNSSGQEEGKAGEKEILEQLMVLKGASRTYSHQVGEGSSTLLDGDRLVTNNLDFTIDASMVHVEETTSHRRYAGYFIRNAEHAQRVFNTIRSSPLPSQRRPANAQQGQEKGQEKEKTQGEKKNVWQPKKRVQIAA